MANVRKNKLTPREARLVEGINAGKTVKQSAIEAGIGVNAAPESARVMAYEVLRRPHVAAALEAALDAAGASVQHSAQVIAAAHKASTVKVFNNEGHIVYAKPLVDHPTRLKAAEMNLRARKMIGTGPEEGAIGGGTVNLIGVLAIVKQAAGERGLGA